MFNSDVKPAVLDCYQRNGLQYTLDTYSCICSTSTIRRWCNEILKYPHVYTDNQLIKEYKRVTSLPGSYTVYNRNKNILHFQPHFYEKEMKMLKDKNIWNKLYANRIKHIGKDANKISLKDMLRGFKISGKYVGYSHFSAGVIKKFIEDYQSTQIYDPCSGWGHRLLGTGNTPYIYNDIWNKSVEGVKKMIAFHNIQNKIVYNNDCTKFTPPENYDAVFTCPPYGNKEIYSTGEYKEQEYTAMIDNMIKQAFIDKKSAKIIGIIICHDYKALIENILIQNNLQIKDIHPIIKQHSHFCKAVNSLTSGEFLIIAKKYASAPQQR